MAAAAVVTTAAAVAIPAAASVEFPRTVRIAAGSFRMGVGRTPLPFELTTNSYHRCTPRAADPAGCGKLYGDYDERHNHRVTISRDFEMTATEVTNRQFEAFDPAHRQQRGRLGFSVQDYEAVIFVSHTDATNYARWLSARDPAGRTWRLPTEAEWEYGCRANTTTYFNTGDTFPASQGRNQDVTDFPRCKFAPPAGPCRASSQLDGFLRVAAHPPNAWGLHDCHGNVEEWTSDWYGASYYESAPPIDPKGPPNGTFRVSRGGSHSTELCRLRNTSIYTGRTPEVTTEIAIVF
jgi:sulfatase modifying factor 1